MADPKHAAPPRRRRVPMQSRLTINVRCNATPIVVAWAVVLVVLTSMLLIAVRTGQSRKVDGAPNVGSLPVGKAMFPIPDTALYVSPDKGVDSALGTALRPVRTVMKAVSRARPGQTIVLFAGLYHEQVDISDNSIRIQPFPGAAVWFDGSVPVAGWARTKVGWVHQGWTASFDHTASFRAGGDDPAAFVSPKRPMAAWPDQVFFDGRQLSQVAVGDHLGGKNFSVDYVAHSLTVGSDPAGHEVRASDLSQAFVVTGKHVVLQGFGVRRYATALSKIGTVRMVSGNGVARDLVIIDNATQGLSFRGPNNLAVNVSATGNGMTGIHGNQADGLVVRNCRLDDNNSQGFNPSPAAAGMKVTRSHGVSVSGTEVMHNAAVGIWLDESVTQFHVVNNRVGGNLDGIQVEISDTGVIAGNRVWSARRGLYLFDTGNVSVYNNSFHGLSVGSVFLSQDGRRQSNEGDPGHDPRSPIPDPNCAWLLRNVAIANNEFAQRPSPASFDVYVLDKKTHIGADAMKVSITGNVFRERTDQVNPLRIGWGGTDNASISDYRSIPQMLAKNADWRNTVTFGFQRRADPLGIPLPGLVAAALHQAVGTRHVGPF